MMLGVALVGITGTLPLKVDTAKADSPVTLLVAASDSLNKNGADYVCDGVNDQVQIQEALNTGDSVILSDGHFYCSASLYFGNSTNLTGQGNSTILTFSSGEVIRSATYIDGITMSDMVFKGIGATSSTSIYMQYDSDISITNCTFDKINVQITGGTAPNRGTSNILIALGALLPAIGGSWRFMLLQCFWNKLTTTSLHSDT